MKIEKHQFHKIKLSAHRKLDSIKEVLKILDQVNRKLVVKIEHKSCDDQVEFGSQIINMLMWHLLKKRSQRHWKKLSRRMSGGRRVPSIERKKLRIYEYSS